jgi:hypothetical protein
MATITRPSCPAAHPLTRWVWLLGASLISTSALAVTPSPSQTIQARYLQDRANCLSGHANQGRATCLQEAGAARAEALRGDLTNPASTDYQHNAQLRCADLPKPERGDCVARMAGQGSVEGSVASGGLLRELVTQVPAPRQDGAAAPVAPGASATGQQ